MASALDIESVLAASEATTPMDFDIAYAALKANAKEPEWVPSPAEMRDVLLRNAEIREEARQSPELFPEALRMQTFDTIGIKMPEGPQTLSHDSNFMEKLFEGVRHAKPSMVFEWRDSLTNAVGWYVVDKVINGVTGGGICMTETCSKDEVADIARNMTKKFTVTSPQIGGGKGGIRFSPQDPRAPEVLRRFIIANQLIFQTFVVTAGDIGTSDEAIEKIFHDDLGIVTCQGVLGTAIAHATGNEDLSGQLAKLILFPANKYFPLIEGAVGYGLMTAIRTIVEEIGWPATPEIPLPRVMIQGFGAVGSSAAYYLQTREIAQVVAISDKDGFVVAEHGIPIEVLLDMREQQKATLSKGTTQYLDVAKNFFKTLQLNPEIITKYNLKLTERVPSWSQEDFFGAFIKATPADVLCPCAGRYAVTNHIVNTLRTCGWDGCSPTPKILAAGANNPFGCFVKNKQDDEEESAVMSLVEDTGFIETRLRSMNVIIISDFCANSGTAQLFHRCLSKKFKTANNPSVAQEVLDACAEPIRTFLEIAIQNIAKLSDLPLACNALAKCRIENPISFENMDKPVFIRFGGSEFSQKQPQPETKQQQQQPHSPDDKPPATFRFSSGIPPPSRQQQADEKKQKTSIYAYPRMDVFDDEFKDVENRIKKVLALGCECVEPTELTELMRKGDNLVAYDGFEPSGKIHIAQIFMKKHIVNTMTKCGFTFVIWLADFFAQLNLKQGGDMQKIRILGEYFIEVWKASGMDTSRVRFLWAFDEIMKRPDEYFKLILDISVKNSVQRIRKCATIMGRGDDESKLQSSQILYPIMQAADIFFLGVSVCQLGLDQRKVNMLAREFVDATNSATYAKPVILSHTMLPSLKGQAQGKMSKTIPDSAIFMDDSEDDVRRKIMATFCAPDNVLDNPCLEYFKWIVFPNFSSADVVVIDELRYENYARLEAAFCLGIVTPKSLKQALIVSLNKLMQPIREHFTKDANAKALLEKVNSICTSK